MHIIEFFFYKLTLEHIMHCSANLFFEGINEIISASPQDMINKIFKIKFKGKEDAKIFEYTITKWIINARS